MLKQTFANADQTPAPHKIVIAMDGPAASGKSSMAKKTAAEMGFAYLDTGAIFRSVALAVLKAGKDPDKASDVVPLLSLVPQLTLLSFENPELRTPEVSAAVPKVAAMPEVRAAVRDYQHVFAKNPPNGAPGIVIDGRDVGTVVFPNADVKLYITATLEERTRRRFTDFKEKGIDITFEQVMEDIRARDAHDTSRTFSPLHAADDAIVLDTTTFTREESLQKIVAIVRDRLKPDQGRAANLKLG